MAILLYISRKSNCEIPLIEFQS